MVFIGVNSREVVADLLISTTAVPAGMASTASMVTDVPVVAVMMYAVTSEGKETAEGATNVA